MTVIIVEEPGEEQFYVMCLDTALSSPRLIRAWKRRSWSEHGFRTLQHLLATGAGQVHSEEAYYGHLVLRLMGCLVLFYTSRIICKGRLTLEEILFSLKHYWRSIDSAALALKALSWGMGEKAACIQAERVERKSQAQSTFVRCSVTLVYRWPVHGSKAITRSSSFFRLTVLAWLA